jgi:hypothetical protein
MQRVFADEARQQDYARQGFTIVRLLSTDAAADLWERIDAARRQRPTLARSEDFLDQSFFDPDDAYRRQVDVLGTAAVQEALLSLAPGFRLVSCGIVIKQPGTGEMNIHRDRTVLADRSLSPLNAWCPLVDVDDGYGNLAVLPGSHTLPNVETQGVPRFYAPYGDALKKLSVSVPLKAGEAILFDNRLLHWSRPNRRDVPRPVLRTVAVPAASRIVFYKLDEASGGRRFALLDSEEGGATANAADDLPEGRVEARLLGYADNDTREVTLAECRAAVRRASASPLQTAVRRLARMFG